MKKTYIALNTICGLEPPKNGVEHVLKVGQEYLMEDDVAQPYVAAGSLVLKADVEKIDDGRKGK